jgi:hypothetical protein
MIYDGSTPPFGKEEDRNGVIPEREGVFLCPETIPDSEELFASAASGLSGRPS